jgi:hypothetical protein
LRFDNSARAERQIPGGSGTTSRRGLALVFCAALASAGCALQQATVIPPPAPGPAAHALPFKGHLLEGDASAVPQAVAMSLDNGSPVTFIYREELSHDDYHIPLIVTALDPVTYAGAPLGDLGVTAFASLSVTEGDRVLGDYTAKVHISKSYTLYKEPTHAELEEAARAAVRDKIDRKLYRDEARLAAAVAAAPPPSSPPSPPATPPENQ